MKHKSQTNFYEATNPMLDKNGFMSICRECCNQIYEDYFSIHNILEVALQLTCQDLDIRFSAEALKQTQSHIESLLTKGKKADRVLGYYKSKLSSTNKSNEKMDTFRYKDSDFNYIKDNMETTSINMNTDMSKNQELYDYDGIPEETVKYWGKNRENWEYDFLVEEIFKIKSSFECPDYGMEMIMKDISFINLDIEKIRQEGKDTKGEINKLIETRSKLMNDANMKPVQATGAEANDQVTFGTLIKKWENEKPVHETLDDEMKKYIDVYMVGHLAKMMNLNNETVDKYEDSLKEYTIDFDSIQNEDEE